MCNSPSQQLVLAAASFHLELRGEKDGEREREGRGRMGKWFRERRRCKGEVGNEKDAICQRLTGHTKGAKRIHGETQMD